MFQLSPSDWALSLTTSYSPLTEVGMNRHSWLAALVQADSSTAVPLAVEPPAAVAHRPEAWLTTSNHEEVTPEAAKFMSCRFHPPLSWSTTNVWVPAGRVTVAFTVAQSCQPPVSGTFILPDRLVPVRVAMCRPSVTPLGEATRKLTVYVPAPAAFTVYRKDCPLPVQPRS